MDEAHWALKLFLRLLGQQKLDFPSICHPSVSQRIGQISVCLYGEIIIIQHTSYQI